MMRPNPIHALLLPLLLAGCGGKAYDVAAGPVIYECFGTLSKVAMIGIEADHRTVLRIDGKAGTFGEWNGAARDFTPWRDGKVTVSADRVTFTGTDRDGDKVAQRSLTLDRNSGHLSDQILVSADEKYAYEATCSARPTAPAI